MYVGTEGGRNGGERKKSTARQTEAGMDRWMHQRLQGKHSGRHALRLTVRLRRRASELELKDTQDFTTDMDFCVRCGETHSMQREQHREKHRDVVCDDAAMAC